MMNDEEDTQLHTRQLAISSVIIQIEMDSASDDRQWVLLNGVLTQPVRAWSVSGRLLPRVLGNS